MKSPGLTARPTFRLRGAGRLIKSASLILIAILFLGAYQQTAQAQICSNGPVVVDDFALVFNGVTYNFTSTPKTSTWTYTLYWNGSPPALSHFSLGVCDDITASNVISSTPSFSSVGPDGATQIQNVIKWEGSNLPSFTSCTPPSGLPAYNRCVTFTFTLNRPIDVAPVLFAAKAGGNQNVSTICGPGPQTAASPETCDEVLPPQAVDMISFGATRYKGGQVVIEWKTANDVDNLGFNIYREQNGNRSLITPQPVAGTAFMTGEGVRLDSGKSYAWIDNIKKNKKDVQYWIEELDLGGHSTWHGPVAPTVSSDDPPSGKDRGSILLTQLASTPVSQEYSSVGQSERRADLKPTPETLQLQASLASQPAVKISVRSEGWYRITQPELIAAGLSPSVSPRRLQMFVDGREIPFIVTGESDGRFDASDAVEFYGIGLNTPTTDKRVYWLVAGSKPGQRIKTVRGQAKTTAGGSFPYTVERRDRTVYYASLLNGDAENFFGPAVYSASLAQVLRAEKLASDGAATLEVSLQGVTTVSHQVKVSINGAEVATLSFNGQDKGSLQVTVPQSLLVEGDNTIGLIAVGGGSDVSLINYISLTYQRRYEAEGDGLRFTVAGGSQVSLSGFVSSSVRVLDVTNPDSPQEVTALMSRTGATYQASLSAPGSGQRILAAVGAGATRQPFGLKLDRPSSWRDSRNQADLVIISTNEMMASLEPLKSLRESQGLKVAIVDVEDAYDEFAGGHKTPQAIKDLLALAASHWGARYVLLAGDATFDPKNYLGLGDFDLVPTRLIDAGYLETASDDWFVDFNSDFAPDIAIGRLPVRTSDDAASIVGKITGYESSSPSAEVSMVADANDINDFEGAISFLAGEVHGGMTVNIILRGQLGTAEARNQLLAGISRGQKVVNYFGHGSTATWRGDLLTASDAAGMVNKDKLAVFVMMTCLNGYFHNAGSDSLAEALVKSKQGGAIAAWASAGLAPGGPQVSMNQTVLRWLFDGTDQRLGDVTARAKANVNNLIVRRTWILFGDPTMKLK
jgi:hypothetical protein